MKEKEELGNFSKWDIEDVRKKSKKRGRDGGQRNQVKETVCYKGS